MRAPGTSLQGLGSPGGDTLTASSRPRPGRFSFIGSLFFDVMDLRRGAGTGVNARAGPDAALDGVDNKGAAPAGAATVAVAAV